MLDCILILRLKNSSNVIAVASWCVCYPNTNFAYQTETKEETLVIHVVGGGEGAICSQCGNTKFQVRFGYIIMKSMILSFPGLDSPS